MDSKLEFYNRVLNLLQKDAFINFDVLYIQPEAQTSLTEDEKYFFKRYQTIRQFFEKRSTEISSPEPFDPEESGGGSGGIEDPDNPDQPDQPYEPNEPNEPSTNIHHSLTSETKQIMNKEYDNLLKQMAYEIDVQGLDNTLENIIKKSKQTIVTEDDAKEFLNSISNEFFHKDRNIKLKQKKPKPTMIIEKPECELMTDGYCMMNSNLTIKFIELLNSYYNPENDKHKMSTEYKQLLYSLTIEQYDVIMSHIAINLMLFNGQQFISRIGEMLELYENNYKQYLNKESTEELDVLMGNYISFFKDKITNSHEKLENTIVNIQNGIIDPDESYTFHEELIQLMLSVWLFMCIVILYVTYDIKMTPLSVETEKYWKKDVSSTSDIFSFLKTYVHDLLKNNEELLVSEADIFMSDNESFFEEAKYYFDFIHLLDQPYVQISDLFSPKMQFDKFIIVHQLKMQTQLNEQSISFFLKHQHHNSTFINYNSLDNQNMHKQLQNLVQKEIKHNSVNSITIDNFSVIYVAQYRQTFYLIVGVNKNESTNNHMYTLLNLKILYVLTKGKGSDEYGNKMCIRLSYDEIDRIFEVRHAQ